jgi:PAS domain S-box-containing protein
MKGEKPIRILHVDDEKNQLEFTKMFLEEIDEEMIVDSAKTPEEAVELQQKNKYDCVISDYKMLKMTGIELAQKVRENSTVPFILYTGQGSEEVAESAFEAGVDDYLRKESEPSHYQVLAKRVRQNVEKHRADTLYRKVVEESRDGIMIIINDKIAFINSAASSLFGDKKPNKLVGKDISEFFIEGKKTLLEKLEECCETSKTSILETAFKTIFGAFRVAEISVSKIVYLGDDAFLCFIRDITQKKRIQEQLDAIHKQASRLSTLLSIVEIAETTLSIMESVFELQINAFLIKENDSLKTMGVRGAPSIKLTLPMSGPEIAVKAAREKKSILVNDIRKSSVFFKASTESLSELAVPAVIDGETVAVLDVESRQLNEFSKSDQKLLETLAFHVAFSVNRVKKQQIGFNNEDEQKLHLNYALGRLENAEIVTYLVNKDLQGSLQSIKNASEILVDHPDILVDIAAAIDRTADHAVTVSEKIRDTVTRSSSDNEMIEANQIVKQSLASFYIPKKIEVHARYFDENMTIQIDKTKMIRVLDNIIRNSVEAMPQGGKITIHVKKKGSNAMIEVKDTGEGIPEEVKERLFEPFNTTKPNHEGLGLTYIKKIIESAGGNVSIQTERGKGTSVTVSLPLKF